MITVYNDSLMYLLLSKSLIDMAQALMIGVHTMLVYRARSILYATSWRKLQASRAAAYGDVANPGQRFECCRGCSHFPSI
jgi:hypothetical protein